VVPLLAIGCCLLLMMSLTLITWVRFLGWFSLGLVFYFSYGQRHSVEALKTAR
jgi:APA family basic amino acid/polyamine antiporter